MKNLFTDKMRKIKYYSDWALIREVLGISRQISILYKKGKSELLLGLAQPKCNGISRQTDKNKIMRYVNFYSALRGRIGIKDTCFTYSILMCHMLRKNGIEAKIHFGARKADEPKQHKIPIEGHCWVSVEGEHEVENFKEVCVYP